MLDEFYSDLAFLIDHTFKDQEKSVKRWSTVECADYKRPIRNVFSRAIGNCPASGRFEVKDTPERRALAEIDMNSHIGDVLEFDPAENCIQIRNTVSRSILDDIIDFIAKRSYAVSD